jgi:hypothetical protein
MLEALAAAMNGTDSETAPRCGPEASKLRGSTPLQRAVPLHAAEERDL